MNIIIVPPPPPKPVVIERLGKDKLRLHVPDCVLSRQELFRLIGELERFGWRL